MGAIGLEENTSIQPKQKGKMVQNAGYFLKERQNKRHKKLEIVPNYLFFDPYSR